MNELKIFVADDDLYFLHILRQHLNNLGIEDVSIFENGTTCIDHLSENPDVVFLDYNMNDMTGDAALGKIHSLNPEAYVVMVSAQEEIEKSSELISNGAMECIQKNENIEEKIVGILRKIEAIRVQSGKDRPNFVKKFFRFLD